MSVIEEVVKQDETYAQHFALGQLPAAPARRLAVVACMDCRLTVEQILGLQTGDAHIIRNAGGVVTEDALRSLIVSHHMLGTQEFMIINHTDCGMLTFRDDELREKLFQKTGQRVAITFHTFTDLSENVRRQIAAIRAHPWIPDTILVRGFVYDVKTGRLHEVHAAGADKAEADEAEAAPSPDGLPSLTPLQALPPLSSG